MNSRLAEYIRRHHLSLLCLALILGGGTAYAAGLASNSVKSRHIANGQVKPADLATASAWNEVGDSDGPEFQSAHRVRCTTSDLTQTVVEGDWHNDPTGDFQTAAFYRDPYGTVHLKGRVSRGECPDGAWVNGDAAVTAGDEADSIFQLPPGFRPEATAVFGPGPPESLIGPNGDDSRGDLHVRQDGIVEATSPFDRSWLSLDGVSFRCAPSGVGGCP